MSSPAARSDHPLRVLRDGPCAPRLRHLDQRETQQDEGQVRDRPDRHTRRSTAISGRSSPTPAIPLPISAGFECPHALGTTTGPHQLWQRRQTSQAVAIRFRRSERGIGGSRHRAPNRPASLPKPCVAGSNPARAPSKIAGQRTSPSVKSADPSLRDRASSTRDPPTTAQGRAVARDGRLRRSASEPRAHQASRRLCAYRVRERVLKLVLGHRCSACGRTDDTVRNQRAVHRHHEVTDVVDRGLAVEGHRKDHA